MQRERILIDIPFHRIRYSTQSLLQKLGFALLIVTPEVKASSLAYFSAWIWRDPAALLNFVVIGWLMGQEMSGYVVLLIEGGTFHATDK